MSIDEKTVAHSSERDRGSACETVLIAEDDAICRKFLQAEHWKESHCRIVIPSTMSGQSDSEKENYENSFDRR